MKSPIKLIILIITAILIIAAVSVAVLVIKPQLGIEKYRAAMTVSDSASLAKNGDNIHFLSTGSSDCILIESDGHFALVDCAEDTDNPRGFEGLELEGFEEKVLAYLKEKAADENGKIHLDFVLGTHSHSDHIGGFDTIIADDAVTIDRAYLKIYDETKINSHEVYDWDNKEVYEQMLTALEKKNIPVISDFKDPEFTLGNFNLTLFNTEYETGTEPVGENDNAIGVLVEKDGRKVFLAADIDNKSGDEERLAPEIGKVDVLKVGHHSYSGSTTSAWLKTLSPDFCIVTNNFESTDKRTLRRIERICFAPILVTGKENGVIINFGDDSSLSFYNNIH